MSTYFNVRCMTCSVKSSLDYCRAPDLLALAVVHRTAFEKMASFMSLPEYRWFSGADQGPTLQLVPFFAEHVGHELKVFDEYGGDWARRDEVCECGHVFQCHYSNGCATGNERCPPHEFQLKKE